MNGMNKSGYFTYGVPPERYDLPHPRLALPVILLIRRVFIRAFELLREQNYDLAAATEDQVTAALRSTIENDLRKSGEVPGFNKRTYDFVPRQAQWANYDNTSIRKSPDIFIKLRDDESERGRVISEFDGLFIEAKPVDKKHPIDSEYCNKGLIRFVRGDYAWAMQEAMMLAYVRDDRTIAGHLIPVMAKAVRMTSLATIRLPENCSIASAQAFSEAEAIHISQHRRDFEWPDGKGPATDVTVYHLWHKC